MRNLEAEIKNFLVENFLFGEPDEDFTSETSFLEEGIIDSTGILELVTFLEETYEIQIEDEELVPENLDSIKNVVQFLKRKLKIEGTETSDESVHSQYGKVAFA
ncbi:MAG TPA: acyl carrier protein [Deltaproteobacteria bacterium]|nr:acyl carrier protein [Deltaproteobacteria bacterium]